MPALLPSPGWLARCVGYALSAQETNTAVYQAYASSKAQEKASAECCYNLARGGAAMTRKRKNISGPSLLVTYRRRCILLERQNARLLSSDPIVAAEAEVARLERRCIDIEDLYEQAEGEVYDLRKALGWQERWAG